MIPIKEYKIYFYYYPWIASTESIIFTIVVAVVSFQLTEEEKVALSQVATIQIW